MASRLIVLQCALLLALLYATSYAFAARCHFSVVAYEHANCTGQSRAYQEPDFEEGKCTASTTRPGGSFIANCTTQSVEAWLESDSCSTGTVVELQSGVCTASGDDAFLAYFWNSAALCGNWLSFVLSLF